MKRGLILAIILFVVGLPTLVLSAPDGGIGVMTAPGPDGKARGEFKFIVSPGQSQRDTVIINNHSDETKTVILEVLDAATPLDTTFKLSADAGKNKFAGTWVKLDRSELLIKPNSSEEVGFEMAPPPGANPGDYAAGIVAHEPSFVTIPGTVQFKVRVGARIYVTVTGHQDRSLLLEKAEFTSTPNKLAWNIALKNTGDAPITPYSRFKLQGLFGGKVQENKTLASLNPGDQYAFEEIWKQKVPRFGLYRASLTVGTGQNLQFLSDLSTKALPDLTQDRVYWVLQGKEILIRVLVLLVIGWLGYRSTAFFLDRRKRWLPVGYYYVQQGESILDVAALYHTSPQELIRLNNFPWPYVTNKGDKLIVPELTGKPLRRSVDPPSFWRYLQTWEKSLYPSSRNYLG